MPALLAFACLAACSNDRPPERPDERANQRLDSIEERLDASELADPVTPRAIELDEKIDAQTQEGPDAEAPDPSDLPTD